MINRILHTHPSPSPDSFENKTSHSHRDLNEKNHPVCKGLWVIFSQKGFENSVASYLSMRYPRVRHRKTTTTTPKNKTQVDLQEIALWHWTSWGSIHSRQRRKAKKLGKQAEKEEKTDSGTDYKTQSGILADTVWYKNLNVYVYTFQK